LTIATGTRHDFFAAVLAFRESSRNEQRLVRKKAGTMKAVIGRSFFAWAVVTIIGIAFIPLLAAAPLRTALSGSVPSWAKAANRTSAANGSDTVVFRV